MIKACVTFLLTLASAPFHRPQDRPVTKPPKNSKRLLGDLEKAFTDGTSASSLAEQIQKLAEEEIARKKHRNETHISRN